MPEIFCLVFYNTNLFLFWDLFHWHVINAISVNEVHFFPWNDIYIPEISKVVRHNGTMKYVPGQNTYPWDVFCYFKAPRFSSTLLVQHEWECWKKWSFFMPRQETQEDGKCTRHENVSPSFALWLLEPEKEKMVGGPCSLDSPKFVLWPNSLYFSFLQPKELSFLLPFTPWKYLKNSLDLDFYPYFYLWFLHNPLFSTSLCHFVHMTIFIFIKKLKSIFLTLHKTNNYLKTSSEKYVFSIQSCLSVDLIVIWILVLDFI